MTAGTSLLLIGVALIALSPAAVCDLLNNTIPIPAGKFFIEEGETLFLNCTIPSTVIECFNATDIECSLGESTLKVVEKVFVLSQLGTAQLWLQILTPNKSGAFRCNQSDLSRCSFIISGSVSIQKGRPLKPVISSCVVRNWTRVQCWWSPSTQRQLEHCKFKNVQFLHQSLSLQSPENSSQWHPICSNAGNETCGWLLNDGRHSNNNQSSALQLGRRICVRVNASNGFLPNKFVVSDPYCFKVEEKVILDAPTNISVVTTVSDASLKWFSPYVDPSYTVPLLYKVRYHSEWQDDSGRLKIFSNESNVVLHSLHPNTVYRFGIQASTSVGELWSQALTSSFRTSPSVPCSQPKVSSSGFFIGSSNETHRNVTLYWKSIPKRDACGPGLCYDVRINSTHGEGFSFEVEEETSVEVVLTNNAVYTLQVFARNSVGFASQPPTSSVVIPAWESTISQEETEEALQLRVEGNQSTVTFHWNHSNRPQVVVYWCQKHPATDHLCQDDLQWSNHRPAVDGQFVLSLAGHFYTYLIGLAVFRENGETSGIHWFKCVYDLEKALDPPRIIEVKAPDVNSTDRLLVTWNSSQCHEDRHISSYLLTYCLYTNDICSELREVKLSNTSSLQHELTGLERNSIYQVWIESESKQRGRSRSSSKEMARTKASGLHESDDNVLVPGVVGGLVGSIIFTVVGLIILLVLFPKIRESPCLKKLTIVFPPLYPQHIVNDSINDYTTVGNIGLLENPAAFLYNETDKGTSWSGKDYYSSENMKDLNCPKEFEDLPRSWTSLFSGLHGIHSHFANPVHTEMQEFPLRSESYLKSDQSERTSLLTAELNASSDRISKPQQRGGPKPMLPALPKEAGNILSSHDISSVLEQLSSLVNNYEAEQKCDEPDDSVYVGGQEHIDDVFEKPPDEEACSLKSNYEQKCDGTELYGDLSERQHRKFSDDNHNAMPFSSDSCHHQPAAVTPKKHYSQIKMQEIPLRSESHLKADQSERTSLLTAELNISSDRISKPQQRGGPKPMLPALPKEAGKIQSSHDISSVLEQLSSLVSNYEAEQKCDEPDDSVYVGGQEHIDDVFEKPPDEEACSLMSNYEQKCDGRELYGDLSERQHRKFSDDNNNAMPFSSDSCHHQPAAVTPKKHYSQIKMQEFPLRSESHMKTDQSERTSLLTAELNASSDRISKPQHRGGPKPMLPALPTEAGKIQSSHDISSFSEQLRPLVSNNEAEQKCDEPDDSVYVGGQEHIDDVFEKPPDEEACSLMSNYEQKCDGTELYGDLSERQHRKFPGENNNETPVASDSCRHPPAAETAKKHYSQIKMQEFLLKSESHLKADQSERTSLLTAELNISSDRISKPQQRRGPKPMLPALPTEAGKIQSSHDISSVLEQLSSLVSNYEAEQKCDEPDDSVYVGGQEHIDDVFKKPPDEEACSLMSNYEQKCDGTELDGDLSERQHRKFSDDNNTAMPFSSDSFRHPPAAVTPKKHYSQIKMQEFPLRSEKHLKADQSECLSLLTAELNTSSEKISKPQQQGGPKSMLPALPKEAGKIQSSHDISSVSEQLDNTDDKSRNEYAQRISTQNKEINPMQTNNSENSSLKPTDNNLMCMLPKIIDTTKTKQTAINTNTIAPADLKIPHGACSADVTKVLPRTSEHMHNLKNKTQIIDVVRSLPKTENYGVLTRVMPTNVKNPLQTSCDCSASPKGQQSILLPSRQFETMTSNTENGNAVSQNWANLNSTRDDLYTSEGTTDFSSLAKEAPTIHQNFGDSTFTSDDGYASGRTSNVSSPVREAPTIIHQNCADSTFTSDDGYTSGQIN